MESFTEKFRDELLNREINQAEIIARETARIQGVFFVKDVLTKIKRTPPQTSLVAEERRQNVKGVFRLKKKGKDRR